jgi:hypothetical protein
MNEWSMCLMSSAGLVLYGTHRLLIASYGPASSIDMASGRPAALAAPLSLVVLAQVSLYFRWMLDFIFLLARHSSHRPLSRPWERNSSSSGSFEHMRENLPCMLQEFLHHCRVVAINSSGGNGVTASKLLKRSSVTLDHRNDSLFRPRWACVEVSSANLSRSLVVRASAWPPSWVTG